MAKFYPTMDQNFHGSDGEQIVYEALRQNLPDSYTVFHSFVWLGNEKQRRSEGEADFVILHPTLGILAIEVKAGGIAYTEGNWIQINRHTGEEKIIDPLGQAAESQHHIINLLRQKLPNLSPRPIVGRAVWFTSVILDRKLPLPPSASPAILLDETDLDTPEEGLKKVFDFWKENLGAGKTDLSAAQFTQVVDTLMPSFRIAPAISSIIRENRQQYVRMTGQQSAILEFLGEQPTASIHGPAGTGKTLLAVEKARMLSATGQKTLYLCFNEFLLESLRKAYPNDKYITFHNVRTLGQEILGRDDIPIEKIVSTFESYLDEEYDDSLWPYPNIIVDEAQDLSDTLLEHLAYLMEISGGVFYTFYDRNQAIMKKEPSKWIDEHADCRLVLYRNCRNTSEIAKLISGLVPVREESYINDIHGTMPKCSIYRDGKDLQTIAANFVKDMLKNGIKVEDIVILSIHRTETNPLHEIITLAGIPISEKREPGKIWFTSIRKFKGLEAQAVLIVDFRFSEVDSELSKRIFYVGCSRANAHLQVALYKDTEEIKDAELMKKLGMHKRLTKR
ncbi:NERD domain-containing protein [Selenomonas sp. AB3002]|uniref:NERD domain-containing protein n=1 Tax=Selenomonas sp. AB3002 TaxID=1392502 RepID=UPI00055F3890